MDTITRTFPSWKYFALSIGNDFLAHVGDIYVLRWRKGAHKATLYEILFGLAELSEGDPLQDRPTVSYQLIHYIRQAHRLNAV